jgi:hypothetical protein
MDERAAAGSDRRVGRKVLASVLLSMVATGALGWGATAVGAAEPMVVVDPSTDLVDTQTVTVTATGFSPFTSFGAAQCDPSVGPGAGTAACDLSTARTTTTDENGAAQITMPVRRIITVQDREVDCALEPCTLGAATISGTTPIEAVAVPITFDPDVPPIPALTLEVTLEDVSGTVAGGTVTCNRDAEAFLDLVVSQERGGRTASVYGYTDEPIACTTSPSEWTASLTGGTGRLTGGSATYEVFGYAYDGFEDASAYSTGQVHVSGGPRLGPPLGEQPGETVRVEVLGTSRGPLGLQVDLAVTCDRAVPEAFASVGVTQWAGLSEVSAYGGTALGPCDGVVQTSVPVTVQTGTLVGGPAIVEAAVEVYDFTVPEEEFFDYATARASVRLRGMQRAATFEAEPNPGSRITITGATRTALNGVLTCEEPVLVELWTFVQQSRGRVIDDASGYTGIECDGPTPFSIELEGALSGGSASAFVFATGYQETEEGYEILWEDQQAASIRVGG